MSVGQTFLAQPEARGHNGHSTGSRGLVVVCGSVGQVADSFSEPCGATRHRANLPGEPVERVLNTSRWGVKVLLGRVKKSFSNRGALEISDGDKNALSNGMSTTWTKGRRCPQSTPSRGCVVIPRRFVIEVNITAATGLLNYAASFGLQHLVKGEVINMLMLLGISPQRCACRRRGGVAQIVDQARVERRNS